MREPPLMALYIFPVNWKHTSHYISGVCQALKRTHASPTKHPYPTHIGIVWTTRINARVDDDNRRRRRRQQLHTVQIGKGLRAIKQNLSAATRSLRMHTHYVYMRKYISMYPVHTYTLTHIHTLQINPFVFQKPLISFGSLTGVRAYLAF